MKLEWRSNSTSHELARFFSITKKAISRLATLTIIVIIVIAATSGIYYFTQMGNHTENSKSTSLILYSADAYVAETAALAKGFTNQTGIPTVSPKGGGSITLAREIAQGNPVSAFVSVSKSAVSATYLNTTASGWAIAFAGDQMSIAYSNSTKQSPAAEKVINSFQTADSKNTTSAWRDFYSNLTSGAVKLGISDPNADPAGFRGWLVLEAAGYAYAQGNQSYFASRLVENKGNVTGASAADLIAPLQAGEIQFLFIYRSVGVAQRLNYLELPSQVNLGNPSYADYYSQFKYKTAGGVESGAPIILYVTVPKDSVNPDGSLGFTSYIVGHTSMLSSFGLTPLSPAVLYNTTTVPQEIQKLVSQGDVILGGSL